jgi:hypothetical protein
VATASIDLWEGEAEVPEDVFLRVFHEAADAIEAAGIPHVFMGGIASAALGRPRWTHDIDVFVGPEDNRRALDALQAAGFRTQETDPEWLSKALKDDVLVDVIFVSDGRVLLDEDMVARARIEDVAGRTVPVMPAEDLIVIKALVFKEHAPRHWYDALALLRREDIDWDYLVERALRYDARRVLSLLVYARSIDQVVPGEPLARLFEDWERG